MRKIRFAGMLVSLLVLLAPGPVVFGQDAIPVSVGVTYFVASTTCWTGSGPCTPVCAAAEQWVSETWPIPPGTEGVATSLVRFSFDTTGSVRIVYRTAPTHDTLAFFRYSIDSDSLGLQTPVMGSSQEHVLFDGSLSPGSHMLAMEAEVVNLGYCLGWGGSIEIIPGAPVNQPPVAAAGDDRTAPCTGPAGAHVVLDGSDSTDPDGNPLTFIWSGPLGSVTGETATVSLPLGTSTVTLEVSDGEFSSSDTIDVTVLASVDGLLPPLAALSPEDEPILMAARAFKRGSTLPLKLRLFCGAAPLCAPGVAPPRIVDLFRGSDALDLAALDLDAGASNDDGVEFRPADGMWMFNLSSRDLQPGTYVVVISLPDGTRWRAGFVLR